MAESVEKKDPRRAIIREHNPQGVHEPFVFIEAAPLLLWNDPVEDGKPIFSEHSIASSATDKAGRRIFTGDLIQVTGESSSFGSNYKISYKGVICFGEFGVENDGLEIWVEGFYIHSDDGSSIALANVNHSIEVIGNVYREGKEEALEILSKPMA